MGPTDEFEVTWSPKYPEEVLCSFRFLSETQQMARVELSKENNQGWGPHCLVRVELLEG
jgi:hypothetical protein